MKKPVMHLYRGAPSARSWSKYQETVQRWTLCGIEDPGKRHANATQATEDAPAVTCRYCRLLMWTGAIRGGKAAASSG